MHGHPWPSPSLAGARQSAKKDHLYISSSQSAVQGLNIPPLHNATMIVQPSLSEQIVGLSV
jgi:hypothetical protein